MNEFTPEIIQHVKGHVDTWISENCINAPQDTLETQLRTLKEVFGDKKVINRGYFEENLSVEGLEKAITFWSNEFGQERYTNIPNERKDYTTPELQATYGLRYLNSIICNVPEEHSARELFTSKISDTLRIYTEPSSIDNLLASTARKKREFEPRVTRDFYDGLAKLLLEMNEFIKLKRKLDENQIENNSIHLYCYDRPEFRFDKPENANMLIELYTENREAWENWLEQDKNIDKIERIINLLKSCPSLKQRMKYNKDINEEIRNLKSPPLEFERLKKASNLEIATLTKDLIDGKIEDSSIPKKLLEDNTWGCFLRSIIEGKNSPDVRMYSHLIAEAISRGELKHDEFFVYTHLVSKDPLMEDVIYGLSQVKSKYEYLRLIEENIKEQNIRQLAFDWREQLKQGNFDAEKQRKLLKSKNKQQKDGENFEAIKKATKLIDS